MPSAVGLFQRAIVQSGATDLLLDRDETRNKGQMADYKRFVDLNLGDFERKIQEAIAAKQRQTTILGSLI
jgi:carboxylesterase type B